MSVHHAKFVFQITDDVEVGVPLASSTPEKGLARGYTTCQDGVHRFKSEVMVSDWNDCK